MSDDADVAAAGAGSASKELDIDGNISSWSRLISSLPRLKYSGPVDELDSKILSTALPTMLNLMVVPLVNAVDTFYVGRLADPLALAAQSAANQCFFTVYFLAAFLPTITAPLVAEAIGKEDWDAAKQRVCESLFLSNVLGGVFSLAADRFPEVSAGVGAATVADGGVGLRCAVPEVEGAGDGPRTVLSDGIRSLQGAAEHGDPAEGVVGDQPAEPGARSTLHIWVGKERHWASRLIVAENIMERVGASGAAAATSISELASSLIYLRLLMRRKLIKWSRLFKPPSVTSLLPLIQGGLAMLLRQATLNVAFISAARRAQVLDPTGISGAAYGITMQIYSLGVVAHLGVQGTAAALVPSARAAGGDDAARDVADRIFAWGSLLGVVLAAVQWFALPMITPLFTPLPEVRAAVRGPAAISSFIHLVNGLVFAGEGTMLGLGAFRDLALVTLFGVGAMVSCLASPLGGTLNGVLLSLAAFNLVQGLAVTLHHVRISPLRRRGFKRGVGQA
eukprot:CAMPEP_0172554182 /NCGR_PEP_ID=MMETSP1067-20121228/53551_1 /TAXON_ID=265564 ORGANISM="Thalassiosira punctigera, Strain Tpunct2005C2" /NCGR_SAMPLE_ID=MMETSP1067 /ASSEMBLY_ACC=CAM_ASM_000444 /LENGTH=506 /DNA_ID=CAMNT_0013342507 /DNA_START=319 /DNA_END=1839 /DNA_ORIENTATION=+